MPKPGWLRKERLHLKMRTWLLGALCLVVGSTVGSVSWVRRHVVEGRPEHSFNVAAPEFFGSAHALSDPPPIAGNKIDVLQNGDEIFPSMLAAIRSAKKSINFEAYIFYSDEIGRQFRDALSDMARQGVKVRVLLDGIGSSTKLENGDVTGMQQAGCEFAYYHPALSWRVDKINRRTHRRIMVIDGKLGYTGGAGFAKEWSGHAEGHDHWRDLQLRIEGPLVAKLQGAFQQHWMTETRKVLSGADEFPALPPVGSLIAQMTASHSHSVAPVPLVQATAIAAAERRIWITNPYCLPTPDQIYLITAAVKRGVR